MFLVDVKEHGIGEYIGREEIEFLFKKLIDTNIFLRITIWSAQPTGSFHAWDSWYIYIYMSCHERALHFFPFLNDLIPSI